MTDSAHRSSKLTGHASLPMPILSTLRLWGGPCFMGSGSNRRLSPEEWKEILSVHLSVHISVLLYPLAGVRLLWLAIRIHCLALQPLWPSDPSDRPTDPYG